MYNQNKKFTAFAVALFDSKLRGKFNQNRKYILFATDILLY